MTFYDDKAATINALVAAVEAIEIELGLLPAGAYATVRTRLDILEARINNPFAPAPNTLNPFYIGNTGVSIQTSFGNPNDLNVLAIPGSLYLREDGYNDEGLYAFRPDGYWHQIDTDPFTACGDLAGNLYCQTVIGIQGRAINPAAPETDSEGDGYILTWNQNLHWWEPQIGFFAAGDLAGNKINQTVVNLQGNKLSVASPTDGYVMTWNGVAAQWESQPPAVVFDPFDNTLTATNIRTNRQVNQSPIDVSKVGSINLSNDSTGTTTGLSGNYSAILSGDFSQVTEDYAVVVGGRGHVITVSLPFAMGDFIGGGQGNTISNSFGANVVVGGIGNTINNGSNSIIVGGQGNTNTDFQTVIISGQANTITSSSFFNSQNSVIVNGQSNSITDTKNGFIGAGTDHQLLAGVNNQNNTILNGSSNIIGSGPSTVTYNTILNGQNNAIVQGTGAIVSGVNNISGSPYTLIQGTDNQVGLKGKFVNIVGDFNISGTTSTNSHYTAIWGCGNNVQDGYIAMFGLKNIMNTGSTFADIHGDNNTVSGAYASIWGSRNTIGTNDGYDAIFGYNNTIANGSNYTYVWGDTNVVNTGVTNSAIWGSGNTADTNSPYTWIYGNNNTVNTNSNYGYIWGTSNQVTGPYQAAWGQANVVSALSAGYSSAWGQANTVQGDYTNAWGSLNTINGYWNNAWGYYNSIINNVSYSNVFGYYGQARMNAQFVQAGATPNGNPGAEQYSRVIVDGNAASGGTFNLNVASMGTPITLEDGKSYDMTIRVLINQTTGTTGVGASFVFDVLAHQESGTAVLDTVNQTLSNPNGTGWTVNLSVSTNQLIINIPAFGGNSRRAVATVEWRELSRL